MKGLLLRRTSGSVVRGALILGVVGFAVAIGIGRMCGRSPDARCLERVKFVNFPLTARPFSEPDLRFVDVDSGMESLLGVPEGDALDLAAASPWHDDRGNGQVVGRWSSRSGKEDDLVLHEFGLARFTFPEGKPLNRIPTEITPTGRLCWLPGTAARILFAAGDGALYRFSFEKSSEGDASPDGCDTRPHPLVWKVPPPGDGEGHYQIIDPYIPDDRGLGGRMLVSMSFQVRDRDDFRCTSPQIWWVQLDDEGKSIEAAGPLTGAANREPTAAREAQSDRRPHAFRPGPRGLPGTPSRSGLLERGGGPSRV